MICGCFHGMGYGSTGVGTDGLVWFRLLMHIMTFLLPVLHHCNLSINDSMANVVNLMTMMTIK